MEELEKKASVQNIAIEPISSDESSWSDDTVNSSHQAALGQEASILPSVIRHRSAVDSDKSVNSIPKSGHVLSPQADVFVPVPLGPTIGNRTHGSTLAEHGSTPAATGSTLDSLTQTMLAQQEWLERLEMMAGACGWTNQMKLVNLITRLRGSAYSFFRSCSAQQRSSYELLTKALTKRFTPVYLRSVRSSQFHERKQQSNESVQFRWQKCSWRVLLCVL